MRDFSLSKTTNLKKAVFYYKTGDNMSEFANIVEFPDKNMSVTWQNSPGAGTYQVLVEFEDTDGTKNLSTSLNINILE